MLKISITTPDDARTSVQYAVTEHEALRILQERFPQETAEAVDLMGAVEAINADGFDEVSVVPGRGDATTVPAVPVDEIRTADPWEVAKEARGRQG